MLWKILQFKYETEKSTEFVIKCFILAARVVIHTSESLCSPLPCLLIAHLKCTRILTNIKLIESHRTGFNQFKAVWSSYREGEITCTNLMLQLGPQGLIVLQLFNWSKCLTLKLCYKLPFSHWITWSDFPVSKTNKQTVSREQPACSCF